MFFDLLKDLEILLFELIIKLNFLMKVFVLFDNVFFEFVIEIGIFRDK